MTTTQKYRIEGGYDFYSALHSQEPDDTPPDESQLCLITRMPLTDDHVVMECSHKFNYLPLYNGLVQRVKRATFGNRYGQISCPFCRHNQSTLLPYNPKFNQVIGVNLYPYKIKKDSGIYTPNMGHLCKLSNCTSDYAYKIGESYYCESHHILGVSIEKQKTNAAIYLLKKQKAEQRKAAKEAKEAKQATALKKSQELPPTQTTTSGCQSILKSGPRKGQMCMCAKTTNGLCGRHTPKMEI